MFIGKDTIHDEYYIYPTYRSTTEEETGKSVHFMINTLNNIHIYDLCC